MRYMKVGFRFYCKMDLSLHGGVMIEFLGGVFSK